MGIPILALPRTGSRCHKPSSASTLRPAEWAGSEKWGKVLEGFCPEPLSEEHIAVNSGGLMLFLRLADVEWLDAIGGCVTLHIGGQTHVIRETFASVVAKLPRSSFRRLGPRTLVNVGHIQELRPLRHRRCEVVLRSGARLTFLRS